MFRHLHDLRFALGLGTALGAILVGPEVLAQFYGSGSTELPLLLQGSGSALSILALGSLPLWGLASLHRQSRRVARRDATFCLAFGVAAQVGVLASRELRHSTLQRFAEESAPLIAAIGRYEAVHGEIPPDIDSLVPTFLPAVPLVQTDGCTGPEYRPVETTTSPDDYGNPWTLVIYCRRSSVDHFCYFPKQNYPDYYERIGYWGYHNG